MVSARASGGRAPRRFEQLRKRAAVGKPFGRLPC
jgi:hypothetical protein